MSTKRFSWVAKKLKYRYAGHVIRESKQKWNNILTTLVPYTGKRGRGWPRMRWSDELIKVSGKGWMREAKERSNWKGLVLSLIHISEPTRPY